MAVNLKQFSPVRHPPVFERVYLYSGQGGSRQTLWDGWHIYRHTSPAIEELGQRLLKSDQSNEEQSNGTTP